MAYRYDADLSFFSEVSSEDFDDLVFCLTHDKDGAPRLTEELTQTESYKNHFPQHSMYWQEVAAELQCFGAHTIATFFRGGKGVVYKEVLIDVCGKLKVNFNPNSSAERIEQQLLMKVLEDSLEAMSPDELKELAESIGMDHAKDITSYSKEMLLGGFQAIFRAGGFKSYQLTLIIANTVLKALIGRGLSLAANATLVRAMAILSGPIGWAITGLWTMVDVGGAAYRVTVPAVIQVAVLRQQLMHNKQVEEKGSQETMS